MDETDYEIDYDDDGNEIMIKITRAMLKERLKAAEKRAAENIKDATEAWKEATQYKRRMDNRYWCDRLASALDDGKVFVTGVDVEVSTSSIDVTSVYSSALHRLPGMATPTVTVTFSGDEGVLRFAEFLRESR